MPFTALIVDDEPLAREGLRLLLSEDAEFSAIHEARNGREAIELIQKLRPDLVFLDVQMPEGDGLSVIRQIGPEVEEINWIEAAENYVQLHTARATHLLHVAMNALEKSMGL